MIANTPLHTMQRGEKPLLSQIYTLGAVGGKDKLISVCRQKVNSQGHDKTKYGQKSLCQHIILWTAELWEFHHIFTGSVQLETKMNLLDFEVNSQRERSQWHHKWPTVIVTF